MLSSRGPARATPIGRGIVDRRFRVDARNDVLVRLKAADIEIRRVHLVAQDVLVRHIEIGLRFSMRHVGVRQVLAVGTMGSIDLDALHDSLSKPFIRQSVPCTFVPVPLHDVIKPWPLCCISQVVLSEIGFSAIFLFSESKPYDCVVAPG